MVSPILYENCSNPRPYSTPFREREVVATKRQNGTLTLYKQVVNHLLETYGTDNVIVGRTQGMYALFSRQIYLCNLTQTSYA